MANRLVECLGSGGGSGRGRGYRISLPHHKTAGGFGKTREGYVQKSLENVVGVPAPDPLSNDAEDPYLNFEERCRISGGNDDGQVESQNISMISDDKNKVHCYANFVMLKQTSDVPVYEYHVSFKPTLESTKMKKKVVRGLKPALGPVSNFDGQVLYLPVKLEEDVTILTCANANTGSDSNCDIEVSIRFIKEREFNELCPFYNILFQRIMTTLGFVEIRRGFYEVSELKDLPNHNLQVWPGISFNVEIKDGGVMVMLDIPNRVIRNDTAYDHLKSFEALGTDSKTKFEKFIIGKIIRCGYNQKCYKIDDVDWESNPTMEFQCKDRMVSYKDYFKRQYNVEIKDLKQPMLISRLIPKDTDGTSEFDDARMRNVALAPETCFLRGLDHTLRSDQKFMKEFRSCIKKDPTSRLDSMRSIITRIFESEETCKILNEWGLELEKEVLTVAGKSLERPTLLYSGNKELQAKPAQSRRNDCLPCYNAVEVKNYLLICQPTDRLSAERFITNYSTASAAFGIRVRTKGEIVIVQRNTPLDYLKQLEKHCTPNHNVQFVVIIMPATREDVYRAVKTFCLSVVPVASQCILSRTLLPQRIQQTTRNICLQINCKMGGSPWGLKNSIKKTMFVGMDAAHDQTRKNPSIIALVASLNDACTEYFSRCAALPIHQEVNTCLRPMFSDALSRYKLLNGELPDRVIFYRDGGSAATFDLLNEYEVNVCKEILREECAYGGKQTELSYICVAKRHPQRLFLITEGSIVANPESGTLVETGITKPSLYDFYIVSQRRNNTTITPTHYTVLQETKPTKPQDMQELAYATTFMYYNYCGEIKVPAVIQYAHKLGQLVSRVKTIPSRLMDNNLYYL